MASITTWQRLEPRSSDEIATGLQGRVHDPLWLLARQWQLGEFKGEDAGSPVMVWPVGEAFQITRYLPGPPPSGIGRGRRIDVSREPLETLVEREPAVRGVAPDLRFAVDAGREFTRLLEAHGVGKFRGDYLTRYALSQQADAYDEPAHDFLELMAGRVIDGGRLYSELNASLRPVNGASHLPAEPAIPQTDQDAVRKAAEDWLKWYDSQVSEPGDVPAAWVTNRMEYVFSVSAAPPMEEIVLTTPEYVEGRLEWDAFSHRPGASLGAIFGESPREGGFKGRIPAPASYPGMPASRWWEFEDARVQFGDVRSNQQDLASMIFLQFALIYGNDWFVIPLELPVGSISRLTQLDVVDSFGKMSASKPFAEAGGAGVGWKMFTLARSGPEQAAPAGPEMMFLPPSLGTMLEAKPVEEVLLMRDEMANLAWAVESFVESRTGDRIDRRAIYNSQHPPAKETAAAALSGGGRLVYKLSTEVPDYWIPLVPVRAADGSVELERGVVPHLDAPPSEARSRILATGARLRLLDEEVPRSGALVTRGWQYARWVDGSTHVWVGRRKDPGRGEGSSGLRFDSLERE